MNQVTKYVLAFGRTGPELESDVSARLKEGYQPIGGPCFAKDGVLLQAMVKYETRWSSKTISGALVTAVNPKEA